jgi:hypothetical protein
MAYTFKHGDRPLDDYTIQRAVGSGGFGEVYYAVSDGGREVAIKYLRNNPQVELRGVGHCINLKSPYLVSIFDVKKNAQGDYFIIMEYCSGPSLRDLLIAEPNGFKPEKAAFFARELAKGLAYLHERGIVHRDLKPGNIFFDDGYVKIGDYGLSKFISVSRHSAQTASVGTVHYMAPEIGSGDYSRGVDIYALGVILYEMLLGRVPFEGSSMAEILMKHLTSQPEVDDLPAPFGQVIRKALEKDPKDRYQNVDEMIDDLLAVEDVKESLAGFSPQSLEGAVRLGAADQADSPMPSPNPIPGYARDFARPPGALPPQAFPVGRAGAGVQLPHRVRNRLERISRKVERKMAKLAGEKPPQRPAPVVRPPPPRPERPRVVAGRWRRMLPALALTVGLAVGLGLLLGNFWGEEAGASTGMLTVAMAGGIGLSRKLSRWFGAETGPKWAQAVVRAGTCTPLLFIGAAPMLDASHYHAEALAVVLGLLVTAVWANWDKEREDGTRGELHFGYAIWRGFWAAVLCSIVAFMTKVDHALLAFWMGGLVTAGATLVLYANSWWLGAAKRHAVSPAERYARPEAPVVTPPPPPPTPAYAAPLEHDHRRSAAAGGPTSDAETDAPTERRRWWFTRAFWSVAAFMLMGGAIVLFVLPLVAANPCHESVTGSIIGCVACASMMIFALRKTTSFKRDGFWRETLRPFLLSVMLFGIGATITGIARLPDAHAGRRTTQVWNDEGKCTADFTTYVPHVSDDALGGLITGLVFSSVLLLITFFVRRKPRAPRPFLQGCCPPCDVDVGDAPAAHVPDPTPPERPAFVARAVKEHRGVTVLVLGILGITVFPGFGIAAWVMGNHDLRDMDAGWMDPTGRGITAAGRVCGIISVAVLGLAALAGFVVLLVAAVGGI